MTKEEKTIVFQYNDRLENFEELEIAEDLPLYKLLDSNCIILFVDRKCSRVWTWLGDKINDRMRFISATISYKIRDKYGLSYKITTVDEGDEPENFKIFIGLKTKDPTLDKVSIGPIYKGNDDDMEQFKLLSEKEILLILEKIPLPEGYKRKMVIAQNTLYGYREYDRYYPGHVIKEPQLFPLKGEVPNGTYFTENYTSRILFSSNNIVLVDLLQKIEIKN